MTNKKILMRSSQVVTTYGVGSIINEGLHSFIATDTSLWPALADYEKRIQLDRLQKTLRVKYFRSPPILNKNLYGKKNVSKIPYHYFPRNMFCRDASCRSLAFYTITELEGKEVPLCKICNKDTLAPMRFIAACPDGHLQEMPWKEYIHWNATKPEQNQCGHNGPFKYFSESGMGGGLSSNIVKCPECNASEDLRQITQIPFSCRGHQPWENKNFYPIKDCKEKAKGHLKGGSALYTPTFVSALDIPVSGALAEGMEKERIKKDFLDDDLENPTWKIIYRQLRINHSEEDIDRVVEQAPSIYPGYSLESIRKGIEEGLLEIDIISESVPPVFDPSIIIEEVSIRLPEWEVFNNIQLSSDESRKRFWAEPCDLKLYEPKSEVDKLIVSLVDKIVLVKRLREVRALKSFTRFLSPEIPVKTPSKENIETNWLPAIEVFGEGIFLSLNESKLTEWKQSNKDTLNQRLLEMSLRWETTRKVLPYPDPGFVLIHTFAHLLIRQLCFESGYQASSIRERIYYQEGVMQGILIYTADSDSEGALGGLVKQGEPEILIPTIGSALRSAHWCSNDPVCLTAGGQGLEGLNRGACHSCTLVSPTSCENSNALLDRGVLIGDSDSNTTGYFSDVLKLIYNSSS